MAVRGGILYRTIAAGEDVLLFVPAEVVVRVTTLSARTPVLGARAPAVGIAMAEGEVVTVLEVGDGARRGSERPPSGEDWPLPGSDNAILCDLGGERVALTGGTVLATGLFEAAGTHGDAGVSFRGRTAAALDVRAVYARAEAAIWAARAAAPRHGDGLG
jgi:hypothetical protein